MKDKIVLHGNQPNTIEVFMSFMSFMLGYKVTSQINGAPQEHYQGICIVAARMIFWQQIRECLDIPDDEPI